MKKFAILGVLVLLVSGLAFATDLSLSATIGNVLSVTLGASSYDFSTITTAGVTETEVVTATFRSNVDPWHIMFSSTNGSKLKNGTNEIPYTLKLETWITTATTLLATTPTSGQDGYYSGTGLMTGAGTAKKVYITIPAFTEKPAGAYTDTIQITIAAGA